MAREAPFHLQRILLKNSGHIVDLAVAGRASNALSDVDAVIEICEFGKIVNALPFDRLVIAETRTDGFEIWAIGPQLTMAIHTRLGGWHARSRGSLNRCVAITAIDAVIADVVLMAELDRLLDLLITSGQIRGPRYLRVRKERRSRDHSHHDHTDPSNVVRTLVKKLCHCRSLSHP